MHSQRADAHNLPEEVFRATCREIVGDLPDARPSRSFAMIGFARLFDGGRRIRTFGPRKRTPLACGAAVPLFRVAMVRAKPSLQTRNVDVKNPSGYSNILDLGFLSVGSFWIIGGYQRCADGGGVGDQGKPVDAMLQGQGKLRGSEPFARLDGEREVPKRPTY